MSSDDPGARQEAPKQGATHPQAGSAHTKPGGPGEGHQWVIGIDEALGRLWVCPGCGSAEPGWQRPPRGVCKRRKPAKGGRSPEKGG